MSAVESIPGFGVYPLPEGKTFEEYKSGKETHALGMALLMGVSMAAYSGAIFTIAAMTVTPLALFAIIPGVLLLAIPLVHYALRYSVIRNELVPPADTMISGIDSDKLAPIGQMDNRDYSIIPCPNSVSGNTWKKDLIEKAESNFVMSGSYCGGEIFDELLDLVAVKMEKNSEFTGLILTCDVYLTDSNKEKMMNLEKRFPGRFSHAVFRETSFLYSPHKDQHQLSSNHVKSLVIDGGKYVAIGGTGYVDKWRSGGHFHEERTPISEGLLNFAMPTTFRDADFVIESPYADGLGQRVYYETLKLFAMWHRRFRPEEKIHLSCRSIEKAPAQIAAFEQSPQKIEGCRIKFLASGVENDSSNDYYEEMVRRVDAETDKITIAHMFVAPERRLREALINAAKRGVKIEIISCKGYDGAPILHYFYAHRSYRFFGELQRAASNDNVKLYLYDRDNVTYHKKVVVFGDNTVVTGSANLGFRSLESRDNEINMVAESKELAAEVRETLEQDKALSVLREDEVDRPLATRILAWIQEPLAIFS